MLCSQSTESHSRDESRKIIQNEWQCKENPFLFGFCYGKEEEQSLNESSVEFRNRNGVMFVNDAWKPHIIIFAPIFNLETYNPSSSVSIFFFFPFISYFSCFRTNFYGKMNELRKKGHKKPTLEWWWATAFLLLLFYANICSMQYAVCNVSALLSALYLHVYLCVLNFMFLC